MSAISGPNWPYDYKAEKERRVSKKLSLSDDLRQVAAEMKRVAIRMMDESGSGDTEISRSLWRHGNEMRGASDIAIEWADEIEKETDK
jgi:hypothetical protein